MKTGRNDPCPCGSGKKYKKCCLGKDRATPASPVSLPSPPPLRAPRLAPPAAPPPLALSPAEARWDACWKEFESRDADGRIAFFLQTLEDDELMNEEAAFAFLTEIQQQAVKDGQRARFAAAVAALRTRRPEVFEDSAAAYHAWLLMDALAEGRRDDVPLIARELALHAGDAIDMVNRAVEMLTYHGELAVLNEVMRIGWPSVRASTNVIGWATSEFAERGVDFAIYDYLERTAAPDPADAALLERVQFFAPDPPAEFLSQLIDDLTGRSGRAWTTADFALQAPKKQSRDQWDEDDDGPEPPPDPGKIALSRLIAEFAGYLHWEEGVSFPKAELVRSDIFLYFVRRHAGELNPRLSMMDAMLHPDKKPPPAPKPGHPLCPDRVTLESYLSGLVGFLASLYHRAAALFEVMPAWLRFLETRGLIDAERRARTVDDIRPLNASLLKLWTSYIDDPALLRGAEAWPADAAKGPRAG